MKLNKSAARVLDILNLAAAEKNPITIAEVSRSLDMPKSSAFELLYTMVEKGYLEIADQRLKSFKLGVKAFQTGNAYINKTNLREEAHPLLEILMQKTEETVFLVIESQGKVLYIDKVEKQDSVKTFSVLGSVNPMHCTGVGKALLAAYDKEKVDEIINMHGLAPKNKYSIKDRDCLIADLEATRLRGYAIDNRESEEEVFCVSAPIYDLDNRPVAAISMACLASRMINNPQRVSQFGEYVNDVALAISRRIGFRGNRLYQ